MVKPVYGIYVQFTNVDDPYLVSIWETETLAKEEFARLRLVYYKHEDLEIKELYLNSIDLEYNSDG